MADRRRLQLVRRAALQDRPDRRMPSDDALFILAAGVDQLICARMRAGTSTSRGLRGTWKPVKRSSG